MAGKLGSFFARACIAAVSLGAGAASAVPDSGRIPVLLYHTADQSGCGYNNNALVALKKDLQDLKDRNWTVIPAYWVAQWVTGARSSASLPDKVVAITFDDAPETDWINSNPSNCPGGPTSGYKVLTDFVAANPGNSWLPHVSVFAIASPKAREMISLANPAGCTLTPTAGSPTCLSFTDSWWYTAQHSGLMEIYNHSADHDHDAITTQVIDYDFYGNLIRVGGAYTGHNFARIASPSEAGVEVAESAAYISSKIGGAWPDLFAYPFGQYSPYLLDTYFPQNYSAHQTYAAFCLGLDTAMKEFYGGKRYCIPRISWRDSWGRWGDDYLIKILDPSVP